MNASRSRCLLTACLCLAAFSAQAMWPFGTSKSEQAAKLASKGNIELRAGDEAWRAGRLSTAAASYEAAAIDYQDAEKLAPGMENGLIRYRLSYCVSQVEQMRNAPAEKSKPPEKVAVTHPQPSVPLRETAAVPAAPAANTTASPAAPEISSAPAALSEVVDVPKALAAARQAMGSGHLDDAVPPLVQVLHQEPANRQALLLMATVRVQQARYDDAIIVIESLRGGNQEDEAVLLLAAGAYSGAGRYFDALLALDKVLKASPNLPQAYVDMAYLLTEMAPDKRSDATIYYQHALKLGVPRDALLEKRLGIRNP